MKKDKQEIQFSSPKDVKSYAINLMWINANTDSKGSYVCATKDRVGMTPIVNQVKKWREANPGSEAEINFWYDSQRTTLKAIANTEALLKEISPDRPVHLRDIREIPFVQENSDLFLSSIPVYFRVDFLKLIINMHMMVNRGKDASIFTDESIGANTKTVLSKNELFSQVMLQKLHQYGMLLGKDTWKPENQFLQMLNTPKLITSLTHSINSCLFRAVYILNHLENVKNDDDRRRFENLYHLPFSAAIGHLHMHFLASQSKEPILVRADIVNEGNQDQWVQYRPQKHGYIMHGNTNKAEETLKGRYYDTKTQNYMPVSKIIKLPTGLKPDPGAGDFEAVFDDFDEATRSDLNPSKAGSGHGLGYEIKSFPRPEKGTLFHCKYWPEQSAFANQNRLSTPKAQERVDATATPQTATTFSTEASLPFKYEKTSLFNAGTSNVQNAPSRLETAKSILASPSNEISPQSKTVSLIEFDETLSKMKSAAKTEPDPVYAKTAKEFLKKTSHERDAFLRTGDAQSFVHNVNTNVKRAAPVLNKSVKWKQFLLDILNTMIFIFTLGIPYMLTGRFRVFSVSRPKESEMEALKTTRNSLVGPHS